MGLHAKNPFLTWWTCLAQQLNWIGHSELFWHWTPQLWRLKLNIMRMWLQIWFWFDFDSKSHACRQTSWWHDTPWSKHETHHLWTLHSLFPNKSFCPWEKASWSTFCSIVAFASRSEAFYLKGIVKEHKGIQKTLKPALKKALCAYLLEENFIVDLSCLLLWFWFW